MALWEFPTYVCIYDKIFHSNTKNILQKEGFNPTGKRNGQETWTLFMEESCWTVRTRVQTRKHMMVSIQILRWAAWWPGTFNHSSVRRNKVSLHWKIMYRGGGKYFNGFILVQKLWLHIFAEEQDCSHFIFAVEAFEKLEYSKNFSIRKNHWANKEGIF